jgi:hypothetical protein
MTSTVVQEEQTAQMAQETVVAWEGPAQEHVGTSSVKSAEVPAIVEEASNTNDEAVAVAKDSSENIVSADLCDSRADVEDPETDGIVEGAQPTHPPSTSHRATEAASQVHQQAMQRASEAASMFSESVAGAATCVREKTTEAATWASEVASDTVLAAREKAKQRATESASALSESVAGAATSVKEKTSEVASNARLRVSTAASVLSHASDKVLAVRDQATTERASSVALVIKKRTDELRDSAVLLAQDPKAQVTAASAVGSAVVVGSIGIATGSLAGGVVGCAAGVPAALFTLGLSIPVGGVLGTGTGFCVGGAVGSTVGLVGGGAAGYGVYTKKDDLRETINTGLGSLRESLENAKVQAHTSLIQLSERFSSVEHGSAGDETVDA